MPNSHERHDRTNALVALSVEAIERGDLERLAQLLDEFPALATHVIGDLAPDRDGKTLLHIVTDWPGGRPHALESTRLLIERGADPAARFRDSETPLHLAASNPHDHALIPALLAAGVPVDVEGSVIDGTTPLMNAVYFGFTQAREALLEAGARIDRLALAAGTGSLGRVDACLRDPHDAPSLRLALSIALMNHHYAIADRLLDAGADIDGDRDGFTPLLDMAYRGDLPMVMFLTERGANLGARHERLGVRAYELAFTHGKPLIMHYLIERMVAADVPIPLDHAASCGRLDLILQAGDDIDISKALSAMSVTHTAVGKLVHPDIWRGRFEIARYWQQRSGEKARFGAFFDTVREHVVDLRAEAGCLLERMASG